MHESIGHLMELRKTLQERYNNPAFAVPYPTMNFGHISGGDAANRICACCELHLDIRPPPGMTLDNINELMHQALEPVSQRWPGRLTIEELHASVPGYECPTDHRMVAVIEELLGTRTQVVNYCTEAPFVQQVCPTWCSAWFHRSGPPAGRIHRHRVYRTDAQTVGPAGQSLLPAINPTFNRGNVLCFPLPQNK